MPADLCADPAANTNGLIDTGFLSFGIPHDARAFKRTAAIAVATAILPDAFVLIDPDIIELTTAGHL
jgi:hypothetical protein